MDRSFFGKEIQQTSKTNNARIIYFTDDGNSLFTFNIILLSNEEEVVPSDSKPFENSPTFWN